MTREEMQRLFPIGSRVILHDYADDHMAAQIGARGTVYGYQEIDFMPLHPGACYLMVNWDDGPLRRGQCDGGYCVECFCLCKDLSDLERSIGAYIAAEFKELGL